MDTDKFKKIPLFATVWFFVIVFTVTAAAGQGLSKITQVTTQEGAEGGSILVIEASGSIQYTAFKLLNPLRLVLDFQKMGKGSLVDRISVQKGVVDYVQPLYFEEAGVMRLEIVLNKMSNYDIQKPVPNKLLVHLMESPQETLAQAPKASVAEAGSTKASASAPLEQISKAKLAEEEKDPCYALLSGKKEKISLDFQDAEIKNLFRIFSEISGFNLILGSDVSGTANMRLLDVPWNQAFEVILANSGLGRTCLGGNIIRIASLATIAREDQAKIEANLRRQAEEETKKLSADLVTEVVRINYADITELAGNLQQLAQSLAPAAASGGGSGSQLGRGRITVDVRTNTLILTDIRSNVDDMLHLIQVLDVASAQVMIEARIVEVNKNFNQDLGIQWGVVGELDGPKTTLSKASDSAGNFLVDLANDASFAAGSTSGFGLALGALAKGVDLDLQLQALEAQGQGRILSNPKVTTLNNKEARISQGDRIPYETSSSDGTTTEFIEAELSLTVTPHITSDDFVLMTIDATKNSASTAFTTASSPASISTKEAHTEVLVANTDTTVLGGIYTSDVNENLEAVPFFSKIPFLGMFFQNFEENDTITELLIFVTPTIVRHVEPPNL